MPKLRTRCYLYDAVTGRVLKIRPGRPGSKLAKLASKRALTKRWK